MFGNPKPAPVNVAGVDLRCQVCENDKFFHRRAQLNTAMMSLFDLDWLNPSAECLLCSNCGYIHWFVPMDWSDEPHPES
jgi:hypothetical protein